MDDNNADKAGEDNDGDDRVEGEGLVSPPKQFGMSQEIHFSTKHEAGPSFDVVGRDPTKSFKFKPS